MTTDQPHGPTPPSAQPNGPGDHPDQAAQPPAPVPPSVPQVAVPVRQPGPFKRGFGLGAGAGTGVAVALFIVGTAISVIMTLMFVIIGLAASGSAQATNVKTVWGKETATKTLRAVDINGPILTESTGGGLLTTGTYGYELAKTIDALEAKDADGLILRINTPGGTIAGSAAIADAIDRYKARTGKKVFAHVQGVSASGGMYAMAGADDIRADHGSYAGSIGVIFGPIARYRDVTAIDGGLLGSGVTAGSIEEFYLTQGRGKDAGTPFRDLTEEERTVLLTGLEHSYADFVDHVAAERGIPAQAIRDDLGAHIYDNRTAEEKKLIDGTMGIQEAYTHFATSAGLDPADTKVVASAAPSTLDVLLGAERRIPGQALPIELQAGVRPVTAASLCGSTAVLMYHGNPAAVCG